MDLRPWMLYTRGRQVRKMERSCIGQEEKDVLVSLDVAGDLFFHTDGNAGQ